LVAQRIRELSDLYRSRRKMGAAIGIDHAYLHRLELGEKTNPGGDVLRALGLNENL
jgi:hypothetical protein